MRHIGGRRPIAYCQRTGRKVPYDEIVEDGEIKGLRVAAADADEEHPLKFYRMPGPDKQALRRPLPESSRELYDIDVVGTWPDELWRGRTKVPVLTEKYYPPSSGVRPIGLLMALTEEY